MRTSLLVYCFFFFQAEDGIRDVAVTGVQTCALPIFDLTLRRVTLRNNDTITGEDGFQAEVDGTATANILVDDSILTELDRDRSEERRVGKSVDLGGRRISKKKS